MTENIEILRKRAAEIPHMGGLTIGPILQDLAAAVKPGHAIVEVGAWLGSGTAQLALGAMKSGAKMHVYDKWTATATEIEKARARGLCLRPGDNLLPHVRKVLDEFPVDIAYTRGPVVKIKWKGGPIGLYVDDASKRKKNFDHVMATFGPAFVPGVTMLVLMDYFYYEKNPNDKGLRYQSQWMAKHPEFEFVSRTPGTVGAVFRYLGEKTK